MVRLVPKLSVTGLASNTGWLGRYVRSQCSSNRSRRDLRWKSLSAGGRCYKRSVSLLMKSITLSCLPLTSMNYLTKSISRNSGNNMRPYLHVHTAERGMQIWLGPYPILFQVLDPWLSVFTRRMSDRYDWCWPFLVDLKPLERKFPIRRIRGYNRKRDCRCLEDRSTQEP